MQFVDALNPALNGFRVLLCILHTLHFYLLLRTKIQTWKHFRVFGGFSETPALAPH